MNAPLHAVSSMATRQVLADMATDWKHFGSDISLESIGGFAAAKRVDEPTPYDLVVRAADAIDKLAIRPVPFADAAKWRHGMQPI